MVHVEIVQAEDDAIPSSGGDAKPGSEQSTEERADIQQGQSRSEEGVSNVFPAQLKFSHLFVPNDCFIFTFRVQIFLRRNNSQSEKLIWK